MAVEHEHSADYTIYEVGQFGQVRIADEVVAIIVGIAATETEGVVSMNGGLGSIPKELISRIGMKALSKGVQVKIDDGRVTANLSVVLEYGCKIPEVTSAIQDKVKSAVESMTGLIVESVNIDVTDVKVEDEK